MASHTVHLLRGISTTITVEIDHDEHDDASQIMDAVREAAWAEAPHVGHAGDEYDPDGEWEIHSIDGVEEPDSPALHLTRALKAEQRALDAQQALDAVREAAWAEARTADALRRQVDALRGLLRQCGVDDEEIWHVEERAREGAGGGDS